MRYEKLFYNYNVSKYTIELLMPSLSSNTANLSSLTRDGLLCCWTPEIAWSFKYKTLIFTQPTIILNLLYFFYGRKRFPYHMWLFSKRKQYLLVFSVLCATVCSVTTAAYGIKEKAGNRNNAPHVLSLPCNQIVSKC